MYLLERPCNCVVLGQKHRLPAIYFAPIANMPSFERNIGMMQPQMGSCSAISGLPAPAAPYLPIEMIRKEQQRARQSNKDDDCGALSSTSTEALQKRLRKRRRNRPLPASAPKRMKKGPRVADEDEMLNRGHIPAGTVEVAMTVANLRIIMLHQKEKCEKPDGWIAGLAAQRPGHAHPAGEDSQSCSNQISWAAQNKKP